MFILLCQLRFLSCNQRWAKRTWKAFLYLCIQGHLEVHRWDRHYATELFTPTNAMMFYVSFKGKTILFEMTGEHYKGRLNGTTADWQVCLPTVCVVTAGFAEVGSVRIPCGTLLSKFAQILCVGSDTYSNTNRSFVYCSCALLNGLHFAFLHFNGKGNGFVYLSLDKGVFACDYINSKGIRVFLYLA